MIILRSRLLSRAIPGPYVSSRFYTKIVPLQITYNSNSLYQVRPLHRQCLRYAHTTPHVATALDPRQIGTLGSASQENDEASVPVPSLSTRGKIAAWLELIEPFLPPDLRKPATGGSQLQPISTRAPTGLAQFLIEARHQGKDVLAHLGLVEERWEATLWLARVLIETCPAPSATPLETHAMSNVEWPTIQPLKDMTEKPFSIAHIPITPLRAQHPLSTFTMHGASAWQRISTEDRDKEALGQIWQTLGSLICAAAEKDSDGSDTVMSCALQIIALLHHKGWIPERTYHFRSNDDPSALQQPPLLHSLSSIMLSSLSDIVSLSQSTEIGIRAHDPDLAYISTATTRPGLLHTFKAPDVGPEIWLEFVLWCCVNGPWVSDGAAIVAEMYKFKYANRWSLIRSKNKNVVGLPDAKWDEYSSRRLEGIGNARDSSTAIETETADLSRKPSGRTISTEVVVALIDGLLTTLARPGKPIPGHSVGRIHDQIIILRGMLERDKMNLGMSTWDAVITRFVERPDLQIENNPRLMEKILELAGTYEREAFSSNAPHDADDSTQLATYIFDASAAILGLYHRTLHAYIKSRDIGGALRLLARLQSLTDTNKTRSLEEFFNELRVTSNDLLRPGGLVRGSPISFHSMFPGVQYPGFFPDIPNHVLADLLDLINESGAVEIGRWMIHSSDVDGPLIPEDLYGHQLLAPALIRFAAATSDASLLVKLTRAQTASVSGQTLVALCDSRIRDGNWDSATNILGLIRDNSLHGWTATDFATLVRPLLLHLADTPDAWPSAQAATLLQRLLRGDLGQVWGPRFSQLDTMVGVLASISPYMAELCSGLLIKGKLYQVDLETITFDMILQGTVKSLGSHKGRDLWNGWRRGAEPYREVALSEEAEDDTEMGNASISQEFAGPVSSASSSEGTEIFSDSQGGKIVFEGYITTKIESLRIIVQQALQEQRVSKAATPETESNLSPVSDDVVPEAELQTHEVLDWAALVLREDFNLTDVDIDYELEGYLSVQKLILPAGRPYSAQTLQIWRAFSGSRKQWVLSQEAKVRNFASNRDERQVVFEYVPPAERFLLHCLAADFGLVSESFGEEMERAVKLSKTPRPATVPSRTVEEVVRRVDRKSF